LRDLTPRLQTLRERGGVEPPNKPPFRLTERVPGYDPRDFHEPTISIHSRDFH
jgi:hypothetical protein